MEAAMEVMTETLKVRGYVNSLLEISPDEHKPEEFQGFIF